jgi:hypothetical protein
MWEIFGMFHVKRIIPMLLKPRYGYEQVSHNCKNIYLYCHKRAGSVTYKCVGFDWTMDVFDTRRCGTLANSHNYSIWSKALSLLHTVCLYFSQPTVHYYNMHWVLLICCPSLVLGYLTSLRVPGSNRGCFLSCPRDTATATLDSLSTHWNSVQYLIRWRFVQ